MTITKEGDNLENEPPLWRDQLKNRVINLEQLKKHLDLTKEELQAFQNNLNFPFAITPHYLDLAKKCPAIRKCVIPSINESQISQDELADPLAEDETSPVPNLIHRYSDRALFLVTNECSTFCRYCTRSRRVGHKKIGKNDWEKCISYISEHSEIRDVIISGGDPLLLSDEDLEYLLKNLRTIQHLDIIRIGTKAPVVLPQRITDGLCAVIKKYHPVFMSIHFIHPEELTPETISACNKLADSGIVMGSQTVLLKGVNDDSEILKELFRGLLKIRVKPYYLYQCDPICGSAHFRTEIERGVEILEDLRGRISGYGIPNFIVDLVDAGGKVELTPNYLLERSEEGAVFKNYAGKIINYPNKKG